MTAPLTPHEQPPHLPPYPGGEAGSGGDEHGSALREIGRGALVAVLVAVVGVALGLLWLWLSPRVPMISDGQAVYLKDTEGEEAVGGDGTFVWIAAILGVVTAALVFWRYRKGGVAVVLGLAAGGVLASVIGWRLGVALGPTTDIVAHAKAVGPKKVFDGPLELRAKSALVVWSAAAMLAHLCLTAAFGPREPAEAPPLPYWGQQPPPSGPSPYGPSPSGQPPYGPAPGPASGPQPGGPSSPPPA
ncbi:ABC transporter permease [Streptomyces sp. V4-01]|uniref:ABC transporter permease n=1 Tax=Actinacidiphila polyblastidii TaxID=3110430 RepID=A0ABU7P6X3_9ACTN|nr:ABC transporter permease [Streptomyces sp. V4-01]